MKRIFFVMVAFVLTGLSGCVVLIISKIILIIWLITAKLMRFILQNIILILLTMVYFV